MVGYRDTPSRGWAHHQNMHCWIRIGPQHLEVSPHEALEGATYLVAHELEPSSQTIDTVTALAVQLFNGTDGFCR